MFDILAALKTGSPVKQFVEGGQLGDAISDIGIQAAITALGKVFGNFARWEALDAKRQRILCLMAICYRYLNEQALAEQTLDRTPTQHSMELSEGAILSLLLGGMINPLVHVEEFIGTYDRYAFKGNELDDLKAAIHALPLGDLPPHLPLG
ncbi:hypothetical protein [Streptomyces fuscichromogenes]|uniref:hypothetical protein n=1 Tax=Streptomyces fuscichromogenes TaxID=1324013 RepID=UPI001670E8AB|nr:hypothetical protein [Streptomyces fuscichromogenes]